MMIFLNRTGFNGLFRLNSRGAFNVPHGRHLNPTICDEPTLRAWSELLGRKDVRLDARPFDASLDDVADGDFVYLDPPTPP